MTYNKNNNEKLIPAHGGYRKLKSYQSAEIVFDLNNIFCKKYIKSWKLREQMEGAGRSGKQNIAEGSMDSGISKKMELKLIGTARGSLEELLLDYEDFLRGKNFEKWGKDHPLAKNVRALAYRSNMSYGIYLIYTDDPEVFANVMICLIHQTNFLLDRQLQVLEKNFLEKGGFTENLYRKRREHRE
jgi:restriction system protein